MAQREGNATWPKDRANRNSVKLMETLTGTRTLTAAEVEQYQFLSFDPGGAARNLDLPAEEACEGVYLYISNQADAAEVITVRNDAGGTIVTPTQAEACVVWCDGVRWCGLVGAQS